MERVRADALLRDEQARLIRWRDELEAEHDDMDRGGPGELSTVDQHLADSASDTAERERIMSLLGTVRQALAEVQDARLRLEQGHFGRCASCGEAIPDERLEAVPSTRFCHDHQGYWEATHPVLHAPGDPVPDDEAVDIERLMMAWWGGRADALPDDDVIGEPGTPGVPLEELDTESALQEDRHVG